MTDPEFRLANNRRCLRNTQCSSGYCRNGVCSDPEKRHDPCRPQIGNCPRPLQCSWNSRTCVPIGYKPLPVCITASDCKYTQTCIKGNCKANIPLGNKCESVKPDLCVMGSKCTVMLSNSEIAKCHELCNNQVSCPNGYKCTENIWNADSICIPIQNNHAVATNTNKFNLRSDGTVEAVVIVLAVIIVILGIIYGWIRLTRSGRDPRLLNSSGKKKKKKLRLNYEGNGLATITVIPSNCQSPQPVSASQLFNAPINEPPPAYSEIINIR